MRPGNEECRPTGHGAAPTSTTQQPAGEVDTDHSRQGRQPGPDVLELLAAIDHARGRTPRQRPEHVDLPAGLVARYVHCIPALRRVRRARIRAARRPLLAHPGDPGPEVQAA